MADIDGERARSSEELGARPGEETAEATRRESDRRRDRAAALTEMRRLVAEGGVELDVLKDKRNYRR